MIKFPSEQTLWKMAATGLGIICGVAIIALMNRLNYMFYPLPDEQTETFVKSFFSDPFLLTGKVIAIAAGCFFGGAITKLVHPYIEIRSAVAIGTVLMVFGIIDLITVHYPAWFWIVSFVVYIPVSAAGFLFINHIHQKKI